MRFVSLSALLLLATPAFALQTTPAPQIDNLGTPATSKPRKVCRTFAVTGQRIAKTICHSKDEWAEIDKANEEAAKNFTTSVGNNATRGSAGGGGLGGVSAIP